VGYEFPKASTPDDSPWRKVTFRVTDSGIDREFEMQITELHPYDSDLPGGWGAEIKGAVREIKDYKKCST
jgi:hypothetical protein